MAKTYEETRYWCEYCRIFVYNNRINREKHESSPQHQANFKKKVDAIRREEKEREKLFPKKTEPISTKPESFYNSTTLKPSEYSTPPTNVLSLKASASAPKKQILGLAPKTKQKETTPKGGSTSISTIESTGAFSVDIKASSSDLKRKIADDELSLLTFKTESAPNAEVVEGEAEIDMTALFKKKKSSKNI